MLQTTQIQREFIFNNGNEKINLPDIPNQTPKEIQDFYSAVHPELITATLTPLGIKDSKMIYHFNLNIGRKG